MSEPEGVPHQECIKAALRDGTVDPRERTMQLRDDIARLLAARDDRPIPMRLPCPGCGVLHLDEGEFATKAHHTHACQECGMVWRPAVVPTVGVRFLPGFKNDEAPDA